MENEKSNEEGQKKEKEEPKTNSPGETDSVENQNAGTQTKEEPNAIENAKAAAKELREETDRREKLIDREEKLHAEKIAMGKGEIIPKTEKAPLTDREYWKKIKEGDNPNV